jgi:signal transduction histidine kinase/CheY-like chemotaxis protein
MEQALVQLIIFSVSIITFSINLVFLGLLWFSDKHDVQVRSLLAMGIATGYWTIFDAIAGVAQPYTYAYMYTLRSMMLVIAPICFLLYMLYLNNSKLPGKTLVKFLLFIIPGIDIVLLLSNPLHRLIFAKDGFPLPEYGVLFTFHATVAYLAIALSVILLIRYIVKRKPPAIFSVLWILSCAIPIVVNVLFTVGLIKMDQDIAPFGFAFMFILLALYSYRSRLSNLHKTALSDVFNSYKNAVIIFNSKNIVEDVNASFGLYFPGCEIVINETSISELYVFFENNAKDDDSKALFEIKPGRNLFRPSGEYFAESKTFHVNSQDVKTLGGRVTGWLLTFSDVSEYIGMIEQINEQNIRLDELRSNAEAASEAKSTFLANMSHEMRTPLNAIIGLSELALRKDLSTAAKNSLNKIYDSGKNLLAVINDILDISKIESGRLELVPVEYDTATMINDTVNLNKVRIGAKSLELIVNADSTLPKKLFGDELRIRQILNNLLSNAIKYTIDGTVELKITAESKSAETVQIKFSVIDTGIGIRKEDIPSLFSEYHQLDLESNRHIEGTGLGLPITARLTELMGGKIEVDSEYKVGSIFSVVLKQEIVDPSPIGDETVAALKDSSYSSNRRANADNFVFTPLPDANVLIVDDVEINLEVAKGMLEPYKLHVDFAFDGAEAVDIIRNSETHYDLVFMDQMMPNMNGIEAVRIIREDIGSEYARNVPIVALTANAMSGTKEMFVENGFQDFLAKPIDPKTLNDIITKWIG